ncbi:MAG TPA: hypothetical protein DCG89_11440, partial [Spartobacteria bacterium]|nr:hypothetical protein [Spartobacteria bacterium]
MRIVGRSFWPPDFFGGENRRPTNCFHARQLYRKNYVRSPKFPRYNVRMRASHLEDFYSFLRFPSISTDDDYSDKVSECAHWLVGKLTGIGLKAELVPTPGHPVVWARNQHREGRR